MVRFPPRSIPNDGYTRITESFPQEGRTVEARNAQTRDRTPLPFLIYRKSRWWINAETDRRTTVFINEWRYVPPLHKQE